MLKFEQKLPFLSCTYEGEDVLAGHRYPKKTRRQPEENPKKTRRKPEKPRENQKKRKPPPLRSL